MPNYIDASVPWPLGYFTRHEQKDKVTYVQ